MFDPIEDKKQAARIERFEKALDALIEVCDNGDQTTLFSTAIQHLSKKIRNCKADQVWDESKA